jgi:hypothetical protein
MRNLLLLVALVRGTHPSKIAKGGAASVRGRARMGQPPSSVSGLDKPRRVGQPPPLRSGTQASVASPPEATGLPLATFQLETPATSVHIFPFWDTDSKPLI